MKKISGVIKLRDTYASSYYGLQKRYIQIQEAVERFCCFYTPETYVAAGSCVCLIAPDGVSAETFAVESGWMETAYKYAFAAAFLESEAGAWNTQNLESEFLYICRVTEELSARTIVNYNENALYLVGYGAGSTIAAYAAMKLANSLAGAVLMGTPKISGEIIEQVGNQDAYEGSPTVQFEKRAVGYSFKQIKLPVWIIHDTDDDSLLEEYWKKANEVEDEGLTNSFARVYNQNILSVGTKEAYEAPSRVWISHMEDAVAYYNRDFTAFIWTGFLSVYLRLRSQQNGTLYYNSAKQMRKLQYFSQEVHGLKRCWAVYAPETYDGSKAFPVLFFAHGHAQEINAFFVNSGLWRLAEKYGFLLVFGLGKPCKNHPMADCYLWPVSGKDMEEECSYIEAVLDGVESEYRTDRTRIYGMGHSNGSSLMISLAEYMTRRFAGFAPIGSATKLYTNVKDIPEHRDDELKYPLLLIHGKKERYADYSEGSLTDVTIKRVLTANGLSMDEKPVEYYNGRYLVRSFYDRDSMLALVKHYILDDTVHSLLPEYCEIAWNFLSGYSRGEDGTLFFNGKTV